MGTRLSLSVNLRTVYSALSKLCDNCKLVSSTDELVINHSVRMFSITFTLVLRLMILNMFLSLADDLMLIEQVYLQNKLLSNPI